MRCLFPPPNPFRTLELMSLEIAFLWLWAFILAIKLTRFWDLGETQYGIQERPLTGCGQQPNRETGNVSHLAYWILNVTPVCQGSSRIRQCQYKQEPNNVSCLAKHLRQIVWLILRNAIRTTEQHLFFVFLVYECLQMFQSPRRPEWLWDDWR